MVKMEQGSYVSPKVLVVCIENDIVTKSDGSDSGEALMYWAESWGQISGGAE